MSKFFINRPIFAIVISIIITLLGLISLSKLPIDRYPQISPPQVQVRTAYMGANAEVVSESVAAVIEKQIVGVQNMDYMQSTSTGDGSYNLTVQFEQGTDADMDTVNVQNRVARALASLPSEVQTVGVTTTKSSGDMAMVFSLVSPNGSYDRTFLKNYATNYMMDAIKSVNGVGTVQEFGADYAMRIWLDPTKMSKFGVTITDVSNAIRSQNKQAAAGALGSDPIDKDQAFNTSVKVQGRLAEISEFENIVIKKDKKNNLLHLKDVARVELGAQSYSVEPTSFSKETGNDKPVAVFAVSLTNDANALETINAVKEVIHQQEEAFPPDMQAKIIVDNTKFVKASMKEVVKTFEEALILVAIIVYLFLQTWQSTVIPMIAVPVSLIGTFAAFQVMGFTVNTLTLLAMVLAIGLVVDDAIVVIEAVEYEMRYNGLKPKAATVAAMEKVQGPVVGIAFVLISVFVPVAFMGGLTGVLYKQFALTVAISVIISAFVALTLTPALCGIMLKPHKPKETTNIVGRFLEWFNGFLDRRIDQYGILLARWSNRLWATWLALAIFLGAAFGMMRMVPSGFVPAEDSGYFMVAVSLPPGATSSRTKDVLTDLGHFLNEDKDSDGTITVPGFDILAGAAQTSGGVIFTSLTDWGERTQPDQQLGLKIRNTFMHGSKDPRGTIIPLNPPSLPGLGNTGGFSMYLINKAGHSTEQMNAVVQQFLGEAQKRPEFRSIYTTFNTSTPSYSFDVNRDRAARDGVAVTDIYTALQGYYGGMQLNDFTKFGKNYKVMLQADNQFRTDPSMNHLLTVRNAAGQMVPVDTYITPQKTTSAFVVTRYNNFPAVSIGGNAVQGVSSGDAIKALEEVAKDTLPQGYSYDWGGQTREEIKAGSQVVIIFGFGIVFVFLVLAALYESWKVPFAVLLSVPTGIFGAVLGPWLFNMIGAMMKSTHFFALDIYFQIGLLTLVGLAAKNAILIIEYAKIRVDERGMNYVDAAIEAAKIRLRPILMTSLAFIIGCLPLMLASGAGAGARASLGVTVVFGMITATFFGVAIIPMLFIIMEKIGFKRH